MKKIVLIFTFVLFFYTFAMAADKVVDISVNDRGMEVGVTVVKEKHLVLNYKRGDQILYKRVIDNETYSNIRLRALKGYTRILKNKTKQCLKKYIGKIVITDLVTFFVCKDSKLAITELHRIINNAKYIAKP